MHMVGQYSTVQYCNCPVLHHNDFININVIFYLTTVLFCTLFGYSVYRSIVINAHCGFVGQ